jgi:hypothetical protein
MKTYQLKKNAGTNPSQMVGSAAPKNTLETAEANAGACWGGLGMVKAFLHLSRFGSSLTSERVATSLQMMKVIHENLPIIRRQRK